MADILRQAAPDASILGPEGQDAVGKQPHGAIHPDAQVSGEGRVEPDSVPPDGVGAPWSDGVSVAFGWKLFMEVQAFTSVPSTEKWSSEKSGATSRWAMIAAITFRDTSVVNSRSRFLVKTVGTHTGSSTPRPTNHRNKRLNCICSVNCRSDRTEKQDLDQAPPGSAVPARSKGGQNRCRAPRTRRPRWPARRLPPAGS